MRLCSYSIIHDYFDIYIITARVIIYRWHVIYDFLILKSPNLANFAAWQISAIDHSSTIWDEIRDNIDYPHSTFNQPRGIIYFCAPFLKFYSEKISYHEFVNLFVLHLCIRIFQGLANQCGKYNPNPCGIHLWPQEDLWDFGHYSFRWYCNLL